MKQGRIRRARAVRTSGTRDRSVPAATTPCRRRYPLRTDPPVPPSAARSRPTSAGQATSSTRSTTRSRPRKVIVSAAVSATHFSTPLRARRADIATRGLGPRRARADGSGRARDRRAASATSTSCLGPVAGPSRCPAFWRRAALGSAASAAASTSAAAIGGPGLGPGADGALGGIDGEVARAGSEIGQDRVVSAVDAGGGGLDARGTDQRAYVAHLV